MTILKKKKVIFALDKIITENNKEDNKYEEIDCAMFT